MKILEAWAKGFDEKWTVHYCSRGDDGFGRKAHTMFFTKAKGAKKEVEAYFKKRFPHLELIRVDAE